MLLLKNVTAEDIIFCIIIVITPSGDVVPPIRDGIDVTGHVKS